MNLRATFYNFKNDREAQDIENLWSLFEIALLYSSDKTKIMKITLRENLIK